MMQFGLSPDALAEAVATYSINRSADLLGGMQVVTVKALIGGRAYEIEGIQVTMAPPEGPKQCHSSVERQTNTGMTLRLASVEGQAVA